MFLFLLCAISMLVIFIERPNDDSLGHLSLKYEFSEGTFTSESGWTYENRIDNLTYIASRNNIKAILRTQYYYGYPLAINASSWEVSKEVTLGSTPAIIVSDNTNVAGHECWACEISNQSYVFFDIESDILVQQYWTSEKVERIIRLEEIILEEPASYVREEGVLLSGILIELAVIIWLLADRLKKSK
jgi:hypothetical protein